MRAALLTLASMAALAAAPVPGAAQTCGIVSGVSAAGGYVSYRVSGGTTGVAVGGDVALELRSVAVQVGYRKTLLEGDAADPDVVRGVVAYPAFEFGGVALCTVAYGGLARFAFESDAGAVLAGGIGGTVALLPDGPIQPYLSVRGLGARTAGTVLGLDIDASGLSLGVEGGVTAAFGPLAVRLTGTVDGFDDGLGITPYPGSSAELALHYRF